MRKIFVRIIGAFSFFACYACDSSLIVKDMVEKDNNEKDLWREYEALNFLIAEGSVDFLQRLIPRGPDFEKNIRLFDQTKLLWDC